ncbi:copper chaperone PCu(A)C [Pseudomonas matsuisoli]|uniref:Copper(I)-binding protein n=1 Tax=Pseudomonas matsuisoli TaxID=1515666 RepID=A0A917PXP2_9PSED|nr:copper chaperone PCu(A)C [Pseudomonas matsuisoli]GGJ97635.1 copper(I)-binding protein [Pseudomonas matsuisoli]
MFKKYALLAALLATTALAHAHAFDAGDLHIDHPWSRELPPNAPTAPAYFVVHNKGSEPDRLLAVETAIAGRAELHEHVHAGDMMKMQKVDSVVIPAGGEITFAPSGYHVMLFDLKQPLRSGDRFPLTLHFERAGDVPVDVAVQRDAPSADGRGNGAHAEHGAHHDH